MMHDGAMCTIPRADAAKAMIIRNRDLKDVKASYEALKQLDAYKDCLENSILAQNHINMSDQNTRYQTLANIPRYQEKIVEETRGVRPEINLWLYGKTANPDYWESMLNGVQMRDDVHADVYAALIANTSRMGLDEAKATVDQIAVRKGYVSQLPKEVFEFYISYYLKKKEKFKAALWHGLYAEFISTNPGINRTYFSLHERMSKQELDKAQNVVDGVVFRDQWLNVKMSDIQEL